MVVGARQSFQFFRLETWFLRNIRGLPEFRYWILHNLISITKLPKKLVRKNQFQINHESHLKLSNL